jgi:4-hydroxybenzoate polyprenyltransferase
MAPLLRLVLILLLMVTVLAGVLVASNARIGWLALAFVVVAGPVAVMVEGRNRSRSRERDAIPRETLKRTDASSLVVSQAHWEAAA